MNPVEIAFDCLPLRSIVRWDVPLDASPGFRRKCERIIAAAAKHGVRNVYYLHNAECVFRLTNQADCGYLQFSFEGSALTDHDDRRTIGADLQVRLVHDTCEGLTEPVVAWFRDAVVRAVSVEFNRYLGAGDWDRTQARLALAQAAEEQNAGYLGMGL